MHIIITHCYSYPLAPSSVPIWLDNLECSPNDTNIRLCPQAAVGLNNCQHGDDIILSCARSKSNGDLSVSVLYL